MYKKKECEGLCLPSLNTKCRIAVFFFPSLILDPVTGRADKNGGIYGGNTGKIRKNPCNGE
jgi:hypothetical protein